ncbi:flagellar basal body-associated protein FliL [Aestuariibius sp. HNIBRBA575]|uniref:flagellar basal body-associated FliL family protein n=1 Tax=Aestuariibius sp. HNIBRBA575 TaxID=3233343 RepID=UPI0034A13687
MSDEPEATEEEPKKASKLPLILGLVFAIVGGAGGFFAVQMGLIGGSDHVEVAEDHAEEPPLDPLTPMSFIELDPLMIAMPGLTGGSHLRFRASLEVPPEYADEVQGVAPRIIDVLNGYLRAVDVADLEDPAALYRLRSQMLRRVKIVTGDGRVSDLLIMEFVPI